MKKYLFAAALTVVLLLTGCSTKQSAMNSLENYTYELRDNAQYYSVKEWENAVDRFGKIRKKIAKHEREFSEQEKRRIGQLEGDCAVYMARGAKNGIVNGVRNVGSEINGIIESISKEWPFLRK